MPSTLIKEARIINRGQILEGDIFIDNERIERIDTSIDRAADREIRANGLCALPGIIDDQVHFREPGLTHKATIATESRAAVAGGTTSYMEMPNVNPPAITQQLLEEKYAIGAATSLANYSFYMGTTNDNLEEVLRTDPKSVCGVKIFMGSSTGNMLVDERAELENFFREVPMLIATHCEDEETIRNNAAAALKRYGEDIPIQMHPHIRSVEGCLLSSAQAIELAKTHNTRLHILHISTKPEIELFRNDIPLEQKRITAEVCVHHLFFDSNQYDVLGTKIKCNPAIKSAEHRDALFPALLDNHFDVIATDHAPHTLEEKQNSYFKAPSGLPLVQHSLNIMLGFYHAGRISLERIVEKMCHAPAICFQVENRGFLDPGYYADIALVDLEESWTVSKDNIYYKCGWSPLEGHVFKGRVKHTFVSGHLAYSNGTFDDSRMGQRLTFKR